MNPVIKQRPSRVVSFFPVLALALAMTASACAGGSSPIVAFGDDSMSHDELVEFTVVLTGGSTDNLPTTVSADSMRQNAGIWLADAVNEAILAEEGVTMTADDRAAAIEQYRVGIEAGQIRELPEGSVGFEAIVRNVWVNQQDAFTTIPDYTERFIDLFSQATVDSSLGRLDLDLVQIVPATSG